jgi:hypothetical protein
MDDREDITTFVHEILLHASDENGLYFFHSIECTMNSDTIIAIFNKQNQEACNEILNDLDIWFSTKFIDGTFCTAFCAHQSVNVFTPRI